MTDLCLHRDVIKNGYTLVDNLFLSAYLPVADATDAKVYLYGLYLLTSGAASPTLEEISLSLKLAEDRVRTAFLYWEKQGLIAISRTEPVKLTYLSVKNPMPKSVNYDAAKYADFVEDAVRLFPDRVLTPNEWNKYFELMEFSGLEPNALLVIMQYCKSIKDGKVGTPYILAVANDWIKEGIKSFEDVSRKIEQLENNGEDIRRILAELGVKSEADLDTRESYLAWKELGYSLDSVLAAARTFKKRGNITKLNNLISELHKAGAYTPFEIEEYNNSVKKWNKIAQGVVKGIGGFYASLDVVVDTYIRPWTELGFDEEALLTVAHYSFISNIKTLEGLNEAVRMFYKLNLLRAESISSYVAKKVATEEEIKSLLELAGAPRLPAGKDREFYREWTENWGLPYDLITEAAKISYGRNFPFSHINRLLFAVKDKPSVSIAEARAIFEKTESGATPQKKKEMLRHDYTKEDLSSVFTDLDETEV